MKYKMTPNEKITLMIVSGLLLTANAAMVIASMNKGLTEAVTTALIGIAQMVVGGLIGFIARDVMKGKSENAENQNPEDPK
jgi:hypothetical protein